MFLVVGFMNGEFVMYDCFIQEQEDDGYHNVYDMTYQLPNFKVRMQTKETDAAIICVKFSNQPKGHYLAVSYNNEYSANPKAYVDPDA